MLLLRTGPEGADLLGGGPPLRGGGPLFMGSGPREDPTSICHKPICYFCDIHLHAPQV